MAGPLTWAELLAGLITNITTQRGTAVLSSFAYIYHLDGNTHRVTEVMGGTTRTTTYTYDTARRLTREVDTGGGTTTRDYTFDTRGNRTRMTVTGAQAYTVNYAYDLNNRLLTEGRRGRNPLVTVFTYDNNGNQLTSVTIFETETRTYNAFNQLTQVSRPGMTVDYTYRPDGLRLSKSMGNITTTHVWDGGHIVAERNQAGGVMNRFDRGAGQRVIRSEHHGFYLYNARGDVVQRANAAGVVTHSYRYTAFGNELTGNQSANEASTNPWRFASMYWDAHTQTYYTPNRRLNPRTGRWLSPDPFWNIRNMQRSTAAITQAGNLFMYTMHNPVRWTDPTGLFAMPPGFGAWWGIPAPGIGGASPIVNKVNAALQAGNQGANAGSKQSIKSPGVSTSVQGTTPSTQAPGLSPLERSWSFSGMPIKCTSPNPKKMDSLEGGGGGRGGVGGSKGGSNTSTSNSGGASNSGSRAGGVGTTANPVISLPANNSRMSTDQALDAASQFLGAGYIDMGGGRFVSADGFRQVRMSNSDILGHHAGGAHMNFETLAPHRITGRMRIIDNVHVYLTD